MTTIIVEPLNDAELETLRADPELAAMFIAEALDHLGTIEAAVLQLEGSPTELNLLNDIFRPFHTVKGNAGALGIASIQQVAHKTENLLDLARSARRCLNSAESDAVLKSVDLLTTMVADLNVRLAGQAPRDVQATRVALLETLDQLAAAPGAAVPPVASSAAAVAAVAASPTPSPTVSVAPMAVSEASTSLAASVAAPAQPFAQVSAPVTAVAASVPATSPSSATSSVPAPAIVLTPAPVSPAPPVVVLPSAANEAASAPSTVSAPVAAPAAPSHTVAATASPVATSATAPAATPAPIVAASTSQAAAQAAADAAQTSVKVDTRKLDSLVDMVGELVIVQSIIQADPANAARSDERFGRSLAQLRRITTELQRNAMSLRMVPIRQTFQKMSRLVRDLSKRNGKRVELILNGEDTELDRKVVEDINDPLMHMVRNSMDHGLEMSDVRVANGKRDVGKLTLSAYHEGGSIVIAIADDGAGLNTDRILMKAREKGLVGDEETLTPSEIHQLIFAPGFSTADKVTEISGRGVGMDVVRRNIEALRGRIDIHTTLGQGTTFLIKLPLTLAILDGLVLRVGDERYVLPTYAVRESLRPRAEDVHSVQGEQCAVKVRDTVLPLIDLAGLLGVPGGGRPASDSTVIVVQDDGRCVALVVDELLGKQEVVIKSLGAAFSNLRGIAGGAILGDGRIGLILDAAGIVTLARRDAGRAA